jgi:MFS family permease
MRPIGGLITGHIGDRHGRKKALVFSLFCMSIPTVALGLLPTYASVGWWSTALLVICRMLQGFSVGGNLPSSLSTLLRRNRRSTGDFMVPQVRVLDLGRIFFFL